MSNANPDAPTPARAHGRGLFAVVFLLWVVTLVFGFTGLLRYSATAGPSGQSPLGLPRDLAIETNVPQPTVVLALHPHCPCSRATVAELDRILSRSPGERDVLALVYRPANPPSDWLDTPLYRELERLGYRVRIDDEARVSGRLGLLTSGQVAFYDTGGRLSFQGGITMARGHEGESAGGKAVAALLRGIEPPCRETPAFGCPLLTDAVGAP